MPINSRPVLKTLTVVIALASCATIYSTTTHAQSVKFAGIEFDAALTLEGLLHKRSSSEPGEPAGFGHGHGDHDHAHHHGHNHALDDGFNAGHSEIAIRARAELLDGMLMIGFDDDDIAVEEAYLTTRALPAGLRMKAGKFLSDIGYMNSRHPHDWDFVERPLVNQYLFGDHGLQETGGQLSVTVPTRNYTHLGIEVLQGNGEGLNRFDGGSFSAKKDNPRVFTAFAKFGPELGPQDAIQLGLSAGGSRQYARVDDHGDHKHSVEGDAWFVGLDAMYRHESGKAYGVGNWRIGGEYYYTRREVDARAWSPSQGWRRNPETFTETQDGIYLEAVYGIAPRWQAGARAEALGLTNRVVAFHPTATVGEGTSLRYALQTTWRPRETMFVRGHLTHADLAGADKDDWAFTLQLNIMFGSHPAHRF